MLCISAWSHTKSIFWLTKTSFIKRKCANLSNSNSSKDFWHLTRNICKNFTSSSFPPLLNRDGTSTVTSISKAELFAETFSANSFLDNLGHILPTHPHSDSTLPVMRILNNDVFSALSGLNPQKVCGPVGVPPYVLKNCASMLTPRVVKLFHLCLSTSILLAVSMSTCSLSLRRVAALIPQTTALYFLVSKAFETILNRKIPKHLSASNLLSDRQHGFWKGRCTSHLLAFPTNSWLFSLSHFGETFTVALSMSKAFDRVWQKSLLSKLPSFGFYPSLCNFISSFFSCWSVSVIVDGHCFTPKPINSGVLQGSVLSPTLFLLFISNLSITSCPLHSTLHYSTSFNRRPIQQQLHNSRLDTTRHLTCDLSIISEWSPLMPQKPHFLHISAQPLPDIYPLFFENTLLSPPTINILGLSLTSKVNWKFHITSITKSASSRLGVLWCLWQFSSPL